MQVRNHGKYTKMQKNNPRGIARCDYSGLMVRHADLIRQMQYRGTGLVWTGYMVNPKFADKPNAQNLTPLIRLDPVPIPSARPDNQIDAQTTLATSVGVITIDVGGSSNVTLTEEQFNNGKFNFTGTLLANIVVYVPNTYNQFYVNNNTEGAFTLGMQLIGNATPPLNLPRGRTVTIVNTLLNLQFVNF